MDTERVADWLETRIVSEGNTRFGVGLGSLLLGLLLAVIGFWAGYVLIHLAASVFCAIPALFTNSTWKLSHPVNLLLAQIFTLLLFWTEWKGTRRPLDLTDWDAEPTPLGQGLARLAGAGGARMAPLLNHPGVTAALFLDLLGAGPRLCCSGLRMVREGYRLRTADRSAAAETLVVLLVAGRKVAYEDLLEQFHPERLREAFRLFQAVEGVVFLDSGLQLSSELRSEILDAIRS